MENTTMNNEVMNEVAEVVVENAPMAIEEINKSNIVDAVKYLANSCKKSFQTIDGNEASFRTDIDELHSSVADLTKQLNDLNDIQKKMTTGGLIVGGASCLLIAGTLLYKKIKASKTEVVNTEVEVEAEEVKD